jgi:hypothetical protein
MSVYIILTLRQPTLSYIYNYIYVATAYHNLSYI